MNPLLSFSFENFGPIKRAEVDLKNLVIISGKNSTGKTYILKGIYAILRGIDNLLMIKDISEITERDIKNTIERKFRWIFQTNLGNLVNINASQNAEAEITLSFNKKPLIFLGLKKSSKRTIRLEISDIKNLKEFLILLKEEIFRFNFIPSSVVLDIEKAISFYRTNDYLKGAYGVPDIYWDFLKDIKTIGASEQSEFDDLLELFIENLLKGKFEYDEKEGFVFKPKGEKKKYPVNVVATGLKLLGILQMLIERNLIKPHSYTFLEEPEVHLHPSLRVQLTEFLIKLAQNSAGVVISTHSPEIIFRLMLARNSENFNESLEIIHLKKYKEYSKGKKGNIEEILTDLTEDMLKLFISYERNMYSPSE